MEGLANTGGAGPLIELGGKSLTVQGHTLRHHKVIIQEIRRQRGNPFELIRQVAESIAEGKPDVVEKFCLLGFREAREWEHVSIRDIDLFLRDTLDGECLTIWLAVRNNDPKVYTLDHVSELYCDELERRYYTEGDAAATKWKDSIFDAIKQASGGGEVGNSDGSSSTVVAKEPAPTTGS